MSLTFAVADLTIHRIVELDAPFLPALEMLPALTPQLLDENRSWNEQYLPQAFLINNAKARVLYCTGFARSVLLPQARRAVEEQLELYGGSFWFRVVGDEAWQCRDDLERVGVPAYLR